MVPVQASQDETLHCALTNENIESSLNFRWCNVVLNIWHVRVNDDYLVSSANGSEAALSNV